MLPYCCVSPQCAMPLCQSYTRFDACPVSCLRCMSPCSTPVLLLSLLSPGSRPVSAGSLCCKLVLALPDFKPTQASKQALGHGGDSPGSRAPRGGVVDVGGAACAAEGTGRQVGLQCRNATMLPACYTAKHSVRWHRPAWQAVSPPLTPPLKSCSDIQVMLLKGGTVRYLYGSWYR